MARAGVKREDGNNDVSSTFDFNASSTGQFTDAGPYRLTLMGWVTVVNATPGSGVGFSHTHRDPSYTTNGNVDLLSTEISGNLDLTDINSRFQSNPEIVDRFDGSALWEFSRTGSNAGGTGEYSIRLVVEPMFDRDLGDFDPVP